MSRKAFPVYSGVSIAILGYPRIFPVVYLLETAEPMLDEADRLHMSADESVEGYEGTCIGRTVSAEEQTKAKRRRTTTEVNRDLPPKRRVVVGSFIRHDLVSTRAVVHPIC
jgi:hypothetical protein